MPNEMLMGIGQSGEVQTRAQRVLLSLRNQTPPVLKPNVKQIVDDLSKARFFTAFYFVANEILGGAQVSNDLFINLDQQPKVGVTNMTSKQIEKETAAILERFELQYASVASSVTTAAKDLVSTLDFYPIFDPNDGAISAIKNGELEFAINGKTCLKVPVSAFEETVDGLSSCPYGLNLEALQLIQTDETVTAKFISAGAFDGNRYFIRLGMRGLGIMAK